MWKQKVSILLALCMLLSVAAPLTSLAEADRPVVTVFDFTEELNQELNLMLQKAMLCGSL